MSTFTALTGELAQARESLSRRMHGVDPSDLAAQRRAYDAYAENDPLPEMSTMSEIDLGGVSCLGLLPKGCSGDHVILWAHGGGFVMGSSRSHKGLAAHVAAAAKIAAIVPDYRLAPEHRHPAGVATKGGDFARHSHVRQQVRTIRQHVEIQSRVGNRQHVEQRRARCGLRLERENAIVLLAEAKLTRRAEHAVAGLAANLPLLDLEAAGHDGAEAGGGDGEGAPDKRSGL